MPVLSERRTKGFWRRVDQSGGPLSCWIWQGQKEHHGYGFIEIGGKMVMAHRVALLLNGVEIGPFHVHHQCRIKLCVNPLHLELVMNGRDHSSRHLLWTQAKVIEAIQGFAREFDHPPAQNDWEPTAALRRGQTDRAERYLQRKSEWPSAPTVRLKFGSWGNAIEAAGFPRPRLGRLAL